MKTKEIVDLLKNYLHLNVKQTDILLEYKGKVPFLLKKKYDVKTIKIEHLNCAILTVDEENVQSIKKHFTLFSESLTLPIVLYINNISNSMQKYLIENHIPFISKESIYLPQLLIYLQGKIAPKVSKSKPLSKLAQQILIFHIIHKKRNNIEIQSTAKQFSVTNMSASRALKELNDYELFSFEFIDRKKLYSIREDLNFDTLISVLKSPIIEEVYLKHQDILSLEHKFLSSFSALSYYTNITNSEKIYAVDKHYFETQIKKDKNISIYEKQYDNSLIKIELWNYSPKGIQKNVIDPLSLYLILKENIDNEDTRLVSAFEELREQIKGLI